MMTIVARGAAREPVTRWTRLEDELGMLCRGIVHSWSADLRTVSTVVGLPGDAEYDQAVRALCQRVADEFGVEQSVLRDGEVWAIRFSRPVADEGARTATIWKLHALALLARIRHGACNPTEGKGPVRAGFKPARLAGRSGW